MIALRGGGELRSTNHLNWSVHHSTAYYLHPFQTLSFQRPNQLFYWLCLQDVCGNVDWQLSWMPVRLFPGDYLLQKIFEYIRLRCKIDLYPVKYDRLLIKTLELPIIPGMYPLSIFQIQSCNQSTKVRSSQNPLRIMKTIQYRLHLWSFNPNPCKTVEEDIKVLQGITTLL